MVVEPASRSDVQKLEAELRLARQETRFELDKLNTEIGKLHQQLHAEIDKLRREMRAEIDKLRQEMHAEIGKLRQEMQTELAKLRTEMATLKFDLLRWIVPLILAQMAMTLGLFVRLSL
jgi:dsDNA-specific endonuclease/ATPase MutS2